MIKPQFRLYVSLSIHSKHCLLDKVRAVFMEVFEPVSAGEASDSTCNGPARVAYKISHWKVLLGFQLVRLILHIELPVVRHLQLQPCMVRSLHFQRISHEVGAQRQVQQRYRVLFLRIPSRKSANRDDFVRLDHHQFRSKFNPSGLGFEVVDLNCWVMRSSETQDFGFVSQTNSFVSWPPAEP